MKWQHFKTVPSKVQLFGLLMSAILTVLYSPVSYGQNSQANPKFNLLKNKLSDYGFTVKLAIPPYSNKYGIKPYGLLESKTRTVWINPIVFELENALATIVHEATHAAQLCAGQNREFERLNLGIEPPRIAHPYFMRYHNYRREIEAEAYTVQVQKNSLELATKLLDTHCSLIDN